MALETLRLAVSSIVQNRMRAFLTTLGIIIGIASVIAMMEIGQGSSSAMQQTVASMGANSMMIWSGLAISMMRRASGLSMPMTITLACSTRADSLSHISMEMCGISSSI